MAEHPMYYDESGNTFLPGYGRHLKDQTSYYKGTKPIPHALNEKDVTDGYALGELNTLRELRMQYIMDELTDKPGWETKIHNEAITSKWREEILASGEDVSSKMIDFIIEELEYKAEIFAETGVISVFDREGVVKSDIIVPIDLKAALVNAVKPLEDVPDSQKDWHPGSDGKVLDLVHPSLFPLVYGLSRILPRGRMNVEEGLQGAGEGIVVPVPEKEPPPPPPVPPFFTPAKEDHAFSRKFQWLPCEVDISGDKARITSYINNLHPKHHKELYGLVEQLIDCSIPLWNKVLTPSKDQNAVIKRFQYKVAEYDRYYDDLSESEGPQREDEEDEYDYEDRRREWVKTVRVCIQPEPVEFEPPEISEPVCIREDFAKYGLQVIVKLANIHLTPEKPKYEGGSWHIEGQLNEHIVSTALYYYSSENITDSKLAFRQQCEYGLHGIGYMQGDHDWLNVVFGKQNGENTVQFLGGVKTPEGRLLTFPNNLQHQVQPFELADLMKPGHRKIIALFLVDPHFKVISTANIPCQRKDWWREEMDTRRALAKLPPELRTMVAEDVEYPYDVEKAKELRLELMEERKAFTVEHEKDLFYGYSFSLCEH